MSNVSLISALATALVAAILVCIYQWEENKALREQVKELYLKELQ